MLSLTAQLLILLILLLLSAFFSGSETALLSLSRLRVRHLIQEKKPGALALKKLKDNPNRMLITLLIGNNLVNVSASAIATVVAGEIFNSNAVGYAIGIMTLLVLLFGEITPKVFCNYHNKAISLLVAKPIWTLSIILFPVVWLFDRFTIMLMKLFGGAPKKKPLVTEEEIKSIVELGEDEGAINKSEEYMIKNIFRFDDVRVIDVMTPYSKIVAIPEGMLLSEALATIIKKPFSRFPVYRGDKRKLIGMVYTKDVLKHVSSQETALPVTKLMKKIFYIHKNRTIDLLLKEFLSKRTHLAAVIDDVHDVVGIVTLEDVLEEIVGEIVDEKEIEEMKLKVKQ